MRWPMILVVVGFLAAAGLLAYAGIRALLLPRDGTPAVATILDCRLIGHPATPSCQGSWIDGGRSVVGVVEGATGDDLGKRLPVVVSGQRAWMKRTASGVGGTALFFSVLCLALAIILPLSMRGDDTAKSK